MAKLTILDKAKFVPLSFTIFSNPRGLFLTVHVDSEGTNDNNLDEIMIVDSVKFDTFREMTLFIEIHIDEWIEKANQVRTEAQA